MEGLELGASVMLNLGSFEFGISTAAYQELTRNISHRWAESELFGQRPSLQYLGPGAETISLPGVVYPEYRGGLGQIAAMADLAGQGQLLDMVSGHGDALGRWAIETVDETNSNFGAAGVPRKMDFTLSLRRAPDAEGAVVTNRAAPRQPANVAALSIPTDAVSPADKMGGLARNLSGAAQGLSATLSNASRLIEQRLAPVTDLAQDAMGAVSRSLGVVDELRVMADRALASVGVRPLDLNIINQAQNMTNRASQLVARADSASVVMRTTAAQIDQLSTVSSDGRAAMREAQRAADAATALARQTAIQAGRI